MRKYLLPLAAAAAGSMLALASPASAQYAQRWVPPVYNYQPYNIGYGFNGGAFATAMHQRVARIQSDVRVMQQRRILGWGEARSLNRQAWQLQRRIDRVSRFGVNPNEARNVEMGIRNLERRVAREANDWNRRPGYGYRRY